MAHRIIDQRDPTLDVSSNGLKMTKPLKAFVTKEPPKRRGPMDGRFTRGSALNLRRKLACLPSETFRLWAATLTMPAQAFRDPPQFKKLFANFCGEIGERLRGVRGGGYSPEIGFLWRLELTSGENNPNKIRTPHLHCVVWSNEPADLLQFSADWCAVVERKCGLERGSLDPQVAAKVSELTSCQQAFQYVANHTSKHKREQLGWPGRQWGIYYGSRENRRKMSPILNRFSSRPVADIKASEDLTDAEREILAHGNCESVKSGKFGADTTAP